MDANDTVNLDGWWVVARASCLRCGYRCTIVNPHVADLDPLACARCQHLTVEVVDRWEDPACARDD